MPLLIKSQKHYYFENRSLKWQFIILRPEHFCCYLIFLLKLCSIYTDLCTKNGESKSKHQFIGLTSFKIILVLNNCCDSSSRLQSKIKANCLLKANK